MKKIALFVAALCLVQTAMADDLALSTLEWSRGNRATALSAIESNSSAEALLQKARLMDGGGDPEAAKIWYEKALKLMEGRPEEQDIRLRLTLMDVENSDALVSLAQKKDQAFRNRAAVALAIMGRHKQAIGLFKVTGQKKADKFRNQLRLAEWAIKAQDAPLAQKQARNAVQMSDQKRDRLYALSLLVEAHRLDNSLDNLILYLEKLPDARSFRVDLLREKGRFAEALTLFKAQGLKNLDILQRRKLIRLYQEAGQEQEMLGEYRALIARSPDDVSGYSGLGEYYVVTGKSEKAESLWQGFIKHNRADAGTLLRGVAAMSEMGFDDLAVGGLESYMAAYEESTPMLFFLFELRKKQGKTTRAEEILTRLDSLLSPTAAQRTDLADAYERLGMPEKALAIWEGLAKKDLGYAEKMRLARLYAILEKPKKAFALWQGLWYEVTTPARRNFIEDRLMTLVTEQGRLADMIVELEEKLANGTAGDRDSGLLVRIYSSMADKISALEVVDEYFSGEGKVGNLKERAEVYRLLGDPDGYEKVTWKLADFDPENRAAYLRNIILNQVERNDLPAETKLAGIKRFLKKLRDADPTAGGGEFEAGVLVLAGLEEEGVQAYRRVITKNPGQGDSYLLIADLLKKQGRADTAITLLQYLAETTRDDSLFVVAIDGIVNVLSVNPQEGEFMEGYRPILKWAQRIILERLTRETDKSYLYRILAEVSSDLSDEEMRLSATANTLVLSNNVRASILRQLIAMDQKNHLAYGRRLVALNEALPPEVYINLGRAFLDTQDPKSATKAFNLALDTAGQAGLLVQTAELFDGAGYEARARDQYNRAKVRDKNNIATLLKFARFQERSRQRRSANGLYMDALHILMLRQPVGGGQTTRDYKDYYAGLVSGALGTWNVDHAREKMQALQDMLLAELDRVVKSGEHVKPLKIHIRLSHMATLVRRIAFATGQVKFADRMDGKLRQYFGHDHDFTEALRKERLAWGFGHHGEKPYILSFEKSLKTANESGFFDRVLKIAMMAGDQEKILKALRDKAKADQYIDAVKWGRDRLDAKNYLNLMEYVVQVSRKNQNFLQQAFAGSGDMFDFLLQAESATGRWLYSESELVSVLRKTRNSVGGALSGVNGTAAPYLVRRLSLPNMLDFMTYSMGPDRTRYNIPVLLAVWQQTVKSGHDRDYMAQVTDKLIELLDHDKSLSHDDHIDLSTVFAVSDFDQVYISAIKKIADFWRGKTRQKIDLNRPLFLLKAGKTEQAVDAFIKAHLDMGNISPNDLWDFYQSFTGAFLPKYTREIKTALQGPNPDFIKLRQRFFYSAWGADQNDVVDFLESVNKDDPDHLARLYNSYMRLDMIPDALKVAERLFKMYPENIMARTGLFIALIMADNPVRAKALNAQSPPNMWENGFFDRVIAQAYEVDNPLKNLNLRTLIKAPDNARSRQRQGRNLVSQIIQAEKENKPENIRKALRTLWQSGANGRYGLVLGMTRRDESPFSGGPVARPFDFSGLGEEDKPDEGDDRLFALLGEQDFGIEELEDYLRTLSIEDRQKFYTLYDYLAQAYKKQSRAADNHTDFTLWLALTAEQAGKVSVSDLKKIHQRLGGHKNLSGYQLKQIARIYAHNGQMSQAAEVYRLLALRISVVPKQKGIQISLRPDFKRVMTATGLIEEVDKYLTGENRLKLIWNITELVRPLKKEEPFLWESYREFMVPILAKTFVPEKALAQISQLFGQSDRNWQNTSLIKLMELQIKVRQKNLAQNTLRFLISREARPQTSSMTYKQFTASRHRDNYNKMLGVSSDVAGNYGYRIFSARDVLFPVPTNQTAGWLEQVQEALNQWIKEDSVDVNEALRILSLIADRFDRAGNKVKTKAVMADISDHLRTTMQSRQKHFTRSAASFAIEAGRAVGQPVELGVVQALVEAGRVEFASVSATLKRMAKEKGLSSALALGAKAADYTQNDDLLTLMIFLSEKSGDMVMREKWRKLRRQAIKAREVYHVSQDR